MLFRISSMFCHKAVAIFAFRVLECTHCSSGSPSQRNQVALGPVNLVDKQLVCCDHSCCCCLLCSWKCGLLMTIALYLAGKWQWQCIPAAAVTWGTVELLKCGLKHTVPARRRASVLHYESRCTDINLEGGLFKSKWCGGFSVPSYSVIVGTHPAAGVRCCFLNNHLFRKFLSSFIPCTGCIQTWNTLHSSIWIRFEHAACDRGIFSSATM